MQSLARSMRRVNDVNAWRTGACGSAPSGAVRWHTGGVIGNRLGEDGPAGEATPMADLNRGTERGISASVLVCAIMPAFIMMAGLAVDGASQVAAQRRAEVVAAQAARVGCDAAAAFRLVGQEGAAAALAAARQEASSQSGMGVEVQLNGKNQLVVTTSTSVRTVFLGILGVDTLPAHGRAVAQLSPA